MGSEKGKLKAFLRVWKLSSKNDFYSIKINSPSETVFYIPRDNRTRITGYMELPAQSYEVVESSDANSPIALKLEEQKLYTLLLFMEKGRQMTQLFEDRVDDDEIEVNYLRVFSFYSEASFNLILSDGQSTRLEHKYVHEFVLDEKSKHDVVLQISKVDRAVVEQNLSLDFKTRKILNLLIIADRYGRLSVRILENDL
ncbi:MAG: hypothetical protein AAF984_02175 [Verrucomicrobiota bacterium]